MPKISRKTFLKVATLAGAAAVLSGGKGPEGVTPEPAEVEKTLASEGERPAASLGVFEYELSGEKLDVPGLKISLKALGLLGKDSPELYAAVVQDGTPVATVNITDIQHLVLLGRGVSEPRTDGLQPDEIVLPVTDDPRKAGWLKDRGYYVLSPDNPKMVYTSEAQVSVTGSSGRKGLVMDTGGNLLVQYGDDRETKTVNVEEAAGFVHSH
ncbi:hypothetical protein COS81_03585 [candidate division WWE3 bacterium CG06_land_8_20_14_3_00_42_16]|uniref:Twin-arginine translocation signal domain-containing protein n=1 Tax=candidate division WWE3 bacterium CG06_land_8_20_14_3_00_42_16 TaxID=1975083 RepID=A0A2M7AMA0_UNCKA|nr:MAG: hypothetical protein COS81_03585 [candidate division WWE3 bacterium CG06_land_8_20_14_3_00_42_16]